jgi:CRISPR-associated protein Cmx8
MTAPETAQPSSGKAGKPRLSRKGAAAEKPREDAPDDGPITVRWDLAELPSSQHKAGLAGLAICVGYLRRKPDFTNVCEVEIDPGGLTLRVDRAGMQRLFDDVYDASLEEQAREKPLMNKAKEEIPPKRTSEKTVVDKKGIEKTKTVYVYDQVVPKGGIIGEWDVAPAGSQKLWLKLWRDLVWTTLRGVPATREPYEARAESRAATDGAEAWDELAHGPMESVPLPSTYYLGAQATTAENVSFRDVARIRVLLHFWPFAIPIYVPAAVDRDGNRDFVGYALAIPDIVDLEGFVADWAQLARERGTEASGYRPRDAIVDVAAEAGLDLARRVFEAIARREGAAATRPWIHAVDVFHVEKEGNNVRVRSVSRLDLRRERVDKYARIRGVYWSAEFRRRQILNILEDRDWWYGFGRLCAITPEDLTIKDSKFRRDCRIALTEVEMSATASEDEKTLKHFIYQITRTYVFGRLASKYKLTWDAALAAANPTWKSDYEDKKAKIAREAFLSVRSRTGADFVSYFTGTICSIPQRLNERAFLEVARALHDPQQIEEVRSLTLLALSANA